MVRFPKLADPEMTVAQAVNALSNDHVHALLIVEDGVLLSVVERTDLVTAARDTPAREVGGLAGRIIAPDARLEVIHRAMVDAGRRRLAVVDDYDRLLGLLCLKRSHRGFCADADVQARAADRGLAAWTGPERR